MDEAKDIANIVFLKVYNKLSTFTAYNSFGGWLRIIANHTAVDYLRETRFKHLVFENESDRLSLNNVRAYAEDDLVNHLTYKQLTAEFEKLPETTRKIFELFYIDNLPVKKISKALSIPTGTIKSTLSRTRRKIKKQLKS